MKNFLKISPSDLFDFIKSTTTVIFLSGFIGLGSYLYSQSFWPAFILSFAGQYILFSFIAHVLTINNNQKIRLKELDKIEHLSSILECGSCKDYNVITFIPEQNERVEFNCKACSKKNSVSINFIVSVVPDPISSDILLKENI